MPIPIRRADAIARPEEERTIKRSRIVSGALILNKREQAEDIQVSMSWYGERDEGMERLF